MKIGQRLGLNGSKHLYNVEVEGGYIEVLVNNSAQAMAIVSRHGFEPMSVNIVG